MNFNFGKSENTQIVFDVIWIITLMILFFSNVSHAESFQRLPAADDYTLFDSSENRRDLEIDRVFQRSNDASYNQIFMSSSRALAALLIMPDFMEPLKRDLQTRKQEYEIIKRNRFYSEEDRLIQIKKIRSNKNLSLDLRKKLIREAVQAPLYKNRSEWARARQAAHENYAIANERLLRSAARKGLVPKASELLKNITSVWFLTEVLAYGVMWDILDIDVVSKPSFTGLRYFVKLKDKERLNQDIDALGNYYEIAQRN